MLREDSKGAEIRGWYRDDVGQVTIEQISRQKRSRSESGLLRHFLEFGTNIPGMADSVTCCGIRSSCHVIYVNSRDVRAVHRGLWGI